MTGKIALILRTLVMYPAAGALAMFFGFVDFDKATGLMTVDTNGASVLVAGVIWASVAGGTFGLSRVFKRIGWAT